MSVAATVSGVNGNAPSSANAPVDSTPSKSIGAKVYGVLTEGLECGSLVGDVVDLGKRAADISSWISGGSSSDASVKISSAFGTTKNIMEFTEVPARSGALFGSLSNLEAAVSSRAVDVEGGKEVPGFFASIGNVVADALILGQGLLEGAELGHKVGVLGERVVSFLNPFESTGTTAYALRASWQNGLEIYDNMGADGSGDKIKLNLMKLARSVCFLAVGVLGVLSTFFKIALAPAWLIPALLVGAIVSSVSSRFFEGLVMDKWVSSVKG